MGNIRPFGSIVPRHACQAESTIIMDDLLLKGRGLRGAVCAQWVRCGTATCKCARGELHGPYFYHFYREHGRLVKRYVKRADVEHIRAACDQRRQNRITVRAGINQARSVRVWLKELESEYFRDV